MSFTMYGADMMLRLMFAPTSVTRPTTAAVALCLNVPPRNAVATQIAEPPSSSTYARQNYAMSSSWWASTGFGSLYNTSRITFPSVVDPWGVLMGWALVDPNTGQLLSAGQLTDPIQSAKGMVPILDVGAIILGIDI
jgi:hypothetical protein